MVLLRCTADPQNTVSGLKKRISAVSFLAGYTVAMVTYYVMERTKTCSPIVGQFFDTMIVASSDKQWL